MPSVVDKILSESLAKGEDANSSIDKLAADLEETKDELIEKLEQLQELSEQSPLLPEPDPAIAKANESIGKLETLTAFPLNSKNCRKPSIGSPPNFPNRNLLNLN